MALLGKAVMLLWFDHAPEQIADFDAWYTREHLPERLSIPGFRRGTRWTAVSEAMRGSPRYFAVYEVDDIGTLASPAYLERLNNPTPWTTKMMTGFRGMRRGFCKVTASFGLGMGQTGVTIRFKPAAGNESQLRDWLVKEVLPQLHTQPGLTSAHLFESALVPAATNEQSIRGTDAPVDWALLVTGYSRASLESVADNELSKARLEQQAAAEPVRGLYRIAYALTDTEIAAFRTHAAP